MPHNGVHPALCYATMDSAGQCFCGWASLAVVLTYPTPDFCSEPLSCQLLGQLNQILTRPCACCMMTCKPFLLGWGLTWKAVWKKVYFPIQEKLEVSPVLCGRMSDKKFDCDSKGGKCAVGWSDVLRYALSLPAIQTVLHSLPFSLKSRSKFSNISCKAP